MAGDGAGARSTPGSARDGGGPTSFDELVGVGSYDGEWLTEELQGISRLSIRVESLLHAESSPYQRIKVYQSDFFGRLLTLDDLIMVTERDEFVYHEMLLHVPLCSIPDPRSVLIVGGGDCGGIREALRYPGVERIVLCELDERVLRVCADWFPWVKAAAEDPRVELVFADGVEYIEGHASTFDLIVVDSTDPVGPAVGLFQRDFYHKVARALKPEGVMTAQTESPHWGPRTVGTIYGQMRQAFANVSSYLGFIPTYPSGCWSWAYASASHGPETHFDRERAARISAACRYYNPEIHRAAFALPSFARELVGDQPSGAR